MAADIGNTAVISPTDGSNNSGTMPSWSGSAAPSTIDDAGRALQGAVAREWENRGFSKTSTGSANAYVVTYTVAPAAYVTGQVYSFKTNFSVTGAATVNINALGAKTIKKLVSGSKTDLASGDMVSGDFVMLAYDGTDMVWLNRPGTSYTVNGQTEETAPAVGDFLGAYDISAAAERKFSITNFWKTITGLTAETAPATGDEVPLYDVSASTGDKITLANMFNVINSFTEDTSPDETADFLLSYDTSASSVKKVLPSNLQIGGSTLGTETATTSGTTVDFTGIPAGVKRITVMFNAVSPSVAADFGIQLGDAGGFETTGYNSTRSRIISDTAVDMANSTTLFYVGSLNNNGFSVSGHAHLTRVNASHLWVCSAATAASSTAGGVTTAGGVKTLSAELTQVRITVTSGSFDSGSVNIIYE